MTNTAAALRANEAVELLHAWMQARARMLDVRMLIIKGPGLAHHGLRAKRTSSDVDVLVHPDDFDRVTAALATAGWKRREGSFAADRYTLHSVAFVAEEWPCDVDVHRYYPGFLTEAGSVFDDLWARHETMEIAHLDCDIPGRLSSILILALHSLRSKASDPRHASELEAMLRTTRLDIQEKAELAALAMSTGSAQTLATVLPKLGVETPREETESAALREWRIRVESGATPTYMWLTLLRDGEHGRLSVLRHALWPSRADLQVMYPGLPETAGARFGTRMQRFGRGVRALPRVVGAVVRSRRG